MNTVTFGNYRSHDDLMLLLTSKKIGTPAPKTELIDIPGGDGILDLTEFFDGTKYKNRQLSFEFATIVNRSLFMQQFTMVQNLLHGKKMRIQLSDDEWYYTGRVSVNDWTADRSVGRFSVDCDCEPYKRRDRAQAVRLCGKNLLDLNRAIITRPQFWTKTATGYNFDRGTAAGNGNIYFEIPVEKGKTYTFSALGTTHTGTAPTLYVYNNMVNKTVISRTYSTLTLTFTATESTVYAFTLIVNTTTTTADFANVMLVEGNSTAFEPFATTEQTVTATFDNLNRAAVPTIYSTTTIYVENGHNAATLSPGDNTLPDFAFYAGDNTLTFKGSGSVLVKWTEGAL